jgi:glycosyltransferase involved in cell wall biosynthesis
VKILWFSWKDPSHPLAGGAEVVNDEFAARLAAEGHEVVFIVAGFPRAIPATERRGYRIVRVGSRFTSYLAAYREYRAHWQGWPDLVIDECNTMPYFASRYTSGRQFLFFHMLCREIWFYELPLPLSAIGWLVEPLYLRLLSRTVPIVAMSESTRRDLQRQRFRSENIRVIPEGIGLEPVPHLDIQKYQRPTLLVLGSLRPMKRTLHCLRAFEIAKTARPSLRLIIAGDDNSRYGRKIRKAARTSPYAADIDVLGPVSNERKIELMQRSHLLLVASVKEGWCLVVTEAASQGTPAVVYDVDGLRDSVQNGETGIVTPSNSPQEMAEGLEELLSAPARYEQIREAAWEASKLVNFDRAYAEFKRALSL